MNFPVFDLHCDTALALLGKDLNQPGRIGSISTWNEQGNFQATASALPALPLPIFRSGTMYPRL